MGVHKGTPLFSQHCTVDTNLAGLHKKIIANIDGADSSYKVVIAVDASVWIMAALTNPQVDSNISSQFHADPMAPVTAASDYFTKRCAQLHKNNFIPVIVFDGQRNPLKEEESNARTHDEEEWDILFTQLYDMYYYPDEYSLNDVLMLRKKTIYPRHDVIQEVIRGLKEMGVRVVGSAFEADHQIRAMYSQGIIDAAISTDTDFIGLGIPFVVKEYAESSGTMRVMVLHKLLTDVLPKKLKVKNDDSILDIDVNDLRFFCNMLGTDYLRNGLPNSGEVDCLKRFREYLKCNNQAEKESYIENYANNHATPDEFRKSFFCWKHAPAFLVVPTNSNVSPRQAFFSNDYAIQLGSMTGVDHPRLYEPIDEKIGFCPELQLRQGHPVSEPGQEPPSLLDFFQLTCWSRTGKPLPRVEPQRNEQGHEVFPGAIINFRYVSIKHQPTRCLKLWLSARGMALDDIDNRQQLEERVRHVLGNNIDALPKFVMRGGGAYVTNSIFKPKQGANIVWKECGDAIDAIRSDAFDGYEEPATISAFFDGQFDSKRKRVLNHLKGGSIPVEDIKVTADLVSDLMPDTEIFVVQCVCAPSQKGIGTKKKLYSVRLAFAVNESGDTVLLPSPFSICDCPVGIGPCAHKGTLVLIVFVIRNCLESLDYADLSHHMPTNINSVAMQCQLVHHLYPAPYSADYGIQRDIKNSVKEKTSDLEEAELDGVALEQRNVQESTTSQTLIDMCQTVTEWCNLLEASIENLGVSHRCDLSQTACKEAAQIETSDDYWRRFNIRARGYAEAVTTDLARAFSNINDTDGCLPPSQYGCFAEYHVNKLEGGGLNLGNISDFMQYPDHIVYPPGVEDEDDNSE